MKVDEFDQNFNVATAPSTAAEAAADAPPLEEEQDAPEDDEKVSRDSINHDNNDDVNAREDDEPPHDNYPGDNEDEEMVNADDGLDVDEPEPTTNGDLVEETPESYPDRSPTPVSQPPPPPPKPDKVEYRAKFLLRGHLRGVSAVRFSPDASMIASGGEICLFVRYPMGG